MPKMRVQRERFSSYPAVVRAGAISVGVGFLILVAKFFAWQVTGATVLLADAVESIVNVIAAAMVTYSVAVASRPADQDHPYGHGKAEPLSAAIEGALIVIAAMVIVAAAIRHIIVGPELQQRGTGIAVAAGAGRANLGLGLDLIRAGRREGSEAVQADGAQSRTDVGTTAGGRGAPVDHGLDPPKSNIIRIILPHTLEELPVFAAQSSLLALLGRWLRDLDGGPGLFQLGLDRVGFVFCDAFLYGGGGGFDQLFGFAQS